MIYARYIEQRPSSKCFVPPISSPQEHSSSCQFFSQPNHCEACKFDKQILGDSLDLFWCQILIFFKSSLSKQDDQSKSFVLARKGRFMRLGQFSCSNHDEGSSAMMASLCIHNKNRDNKKKQLQLYDL